MAETVDRRGFLNRTASSGAAVALAVSGPAILAGESPGRRVVLGVMGLSRGRSLAIGFTGQPNTEVRYVCDVDENRAAAAANLIKKAGGESVQPVGDFDRS